MDASRSSDLRARKVRVVAKIRAFTDRELEFSEGLSTKPWISVQKPEGDSLGNVTISFRDQPTSRRETYEVDNCYEQHEDNCLIFSREVKPLIARVLDGGNASVIACGARGSGKTCTIQGFDEQPGLAVLAMAEILSMAEKTGKSVTISYYEVFQDQVYDLLDPKRRTVMVLEDAQGKIQLKGISQVEIKSLSEFQKLYFSGCDSIKATQKVANELPRRSHKGLMLHVSSRDENLNTNLVGKMNFVDLAGYEDSRRKSSDGSIFAENARINKSLYALQNVVCALNSKESHVPYRESKLTRMLQDSLGGTNQILMVTCLNPSFCQDTIYMASSASRCCQGINRVSLDSTKKTKSTGRSMVPSSSKIVKSGTVSVSIKKQTSSRFPLSEKKPKAAALGVKGRKLFEEANQMNISEQAKSLSKIASAKVPVLQKEEKSISDVSKATIKTIEEEIMPAVDLNDIEPTAIIEKEITSSVDLNDIESTAIVEKEITSSVDLNDIESTAIVEKVVSPHTEKNYPEVTPKNITTKTLTSLEEGLDIEKEEKISLTNEGGSPPLSTRLRELSNTLKSIYCSTPLCIIPQKNDTLHPQVSNDIVEPKTPMTEQTLRVNNKWVGANTISPREIYSMHSKGMKTSLVQEHLKFLNSANKEELKGLKGIGEKRATYILQLRENSPEHFKNLDDLKDIGLSGKQIKGMMRKVAGDMFS